MQNQARTPSQGSNRSRKSNIPMETEEGPLTNKKFRLLTKDNEKLTNLHGQMDQMYIDFEDMKRTREEAKKQLEAKFQDVYRRIQATKDFVVSEGKRINDTLKAFKSKFENQLNELDEKFQTMHDALQKDMNEQFEGVAKELVRIEEKLEQEKRDRIKQTKEQLGDIKR
jgi:hypothetical protein